MGQREQEPAARILGQRWVGQSGFECGQVRGGQLRRAAAASPAARGDRGHPAGKWRPGRPPRPDPRADEFVKSAPGSGVRPGSGLSRHRSQIVLAGFVQTPFVRLGRAPDAPRPAAARSRQHAPPAGNRLMRLVPFVVEPGQLDRPIFRLELDGFLQPGQAPRRDGPGVAGSARMRWPTRGPHRASLPQCGPGVVELIECTESIAEIVTHLRRVGVEADGLPTMCKCLLGFILI